MAKTKTPAPKEKKELTPAQLKKQQEKAAVQAFALKKTPVKKINKKGWVTEVKNKTYLDADGKPIENLKGMPVILTPEVEQDALQSLADCPIEEEVPRIVNGKKVYDNRMVGQVWRPDDPDCRKRMQEIIASLYAVFPDDKKVAELMGLGERVDVLKNWLKTYPDLHQSKNMGMVGKRVEYLKALDRLALGGTRMRESVSKGEVFRLEEDVLPEKDTLAMVLRQTFKGEFKKDDDGGVKTAIQINISEKEKNY
jgi:hypothetical protein